MSPPSGVTPLHGGVLAPGQAIELLLKCKADPAGQTMVDGAVLRALLVHSPRRRTRSKRASACSARPSARRRTSAPSSAGRTRCARSARWRRRSRPRTRSQVAGRRVDEALSPRTETRGRRRRRRRSRRSAGAPRPAADDGDSFAATTTSWGCSSRRRRAEGAAASTPSRDAPPAQAQGGRPRPRDREAVPPQGGRCRDHRSRDPTRR